MGSFPSRFSKPTEQTPTQYHPGEELSPYRWSRVRRHKRTPHEEISQRSADRTQAQDYHNDAATQKQHDPSKEQNSSSQHHGCSCRRAGHLRQAHTATKSKGKKKAGKQEILYYRPTKPDEGKKDVGKRQAETRMVRDEDLVMKGKGKAVVVQGHPSTMM